MIATGISDSVRATGKANALLIRSHGSKLRTVFWQGWLAVRAKPLRIPLAVQVEIPTLPKPKRPAK
jgi:hypothetical protein